MVGDTSGVPRWRSADASLFHVRLDGFSLRGASCEVLLLSVNWRGLFTPALPLFEVTVTEGVFVEEYAKEQHDEEQHASFSWFFFFLLELVALWLLRDVVLRLVKCEFRSTAATVAVGEARCELSLDEKAIRVEVTASKLTGEGAGVDECVAWARVPWRAQGASRRACKFGFTAPRLTVTPPSCSKKQQSSSGGSSSSTTTKTQWWRRLSGTVHIAETCVVLPETQQLLGTARLHFAEGRLAAELEGAADGLRFSLTARLSESLDRLTVDLADVSLDEKILKDLLLSLSGSSESESPLPRVEVHLESGASLQTFNGIFFCCGGETRLLRERSGDVQATSAEISWKSSNGTTLKVSTAALGVDGKGRALLTCAEVGVLLSLPEEPAATPLEAQLASLETQLETHLAALQAMLPGGLEAQLGVVSVAERRGTFRVEESRLLVVEGGSKAALSCARVHLAAPGILGARGEVGGLELSLSQRNGTFLAKLAASTASISLEAEEHSPFDAMLLGLDLGCPLATPADAMAGCASLRVRSGDLELAMVTAARFNASDSTCATARLAYLGAPWAALVAKIAEIAPAGQTAGSSTKYSLNADALEFALLVARESPRELGVRCAAGQLDLLLADDVFGLTVAGQRATLHAGREVNDGATHLAALGDDLSARLELRTSSEGGTTMSLEVEVESLDFAAPLDQHTHRLVRQVLWRNLGGADEVVKEHEEGPAMEFRVALTARSRARAVLLTEAGAASLAVDGPTSLILERKESFEMILALRNVAFNELLAAPVVELVMKPGASLTFRIADAQLLDWRPKAWFALKDFFGFDYARDPLDGPFFEEQPVAATATVDENSVFELLLERSKVRLSDLEVAPQGRVHFAKTWGANGEATSIWTATDIRARIDDVNATIDSATLDMAAEQPFKVKANRAALNSASLSALQTAVTGTLAAVRHATGMVVDSGVEVTTSEVTKLLFADVQIAAVVLAVAAADFTVESTEGVEVQCFSTHLKAQFRARVVVASQPPIAVEEAQGLTFDYATGLAIDGLELEMPLDIGRTRVGPVRYQNGLLELEDLESTIAEKIAQVTLLKDDTGWLIKTTSISLLNADKLIATARSFDKKQESSSGGQVVRVQIESLDCSCLMGPHRVVVGPVDFQKGTLSLWDPKLFNEEHDELAHLTSPCAFTITSDDAVWRLRLEGNKEQRPRLALDLGNLGGGSPPADDPEKEQAAPSLVRVAEALAGLGAIDLEMDLRLLRGARLLALDVSVSAKVLQGSSTLVETSAMALLGGELLETLARFPDVALRLGRDGAATAELLACSLELTPAEIAAAAAFAAAAAGGAGLQAAAGVARGLCDDDGRLANILRVLSEQQRQQQQQQQQETPCSSSKCFFDVIFEGPKLGLVLAMRRGRVFVQKAGDTDRLQVGDRLVAIAGADDLTDLKSLAEVGARIKEQARPLAITFERKTPRAARIGRLEVWPALDVRLADLRVRLDRVLIDGAAAVTLGDLRVDVERLGGWEPLLEPCTLEINERTIKTRFLAINASPVNVQRVLQLHGVVARGLATLPAQEEEEEEEALSVELLVEECCLSVIDRQCEALVVHLDGTRVALRRDADRCALEVDFFDAQLDARRGRFPVFLRGTPRRKKLKDIIEEPSQRPSRIFAAHCAWRRASAEAAGPTGGVVVVTRASDDDDDDDSGESEKTAEDHDDGYFAADLPSPKTGGTPRCIVVDELRVSLDRSLDVYIDEDFIRSAGDLAGRLLASCDQQAAEAAPTEAGRALKFERLLVSPIRARLSVRWSATSEAPTLYSEARAAQKRLRAQQNPLPRQSVAQSDGSRERLRALLDVFAAVERSRVTLPPLRLQDAVFADCDDFAAVAKQHYSRSAARNALEIAGSLRAIGNPLGLARGVLRGLEDAVREPVAGLIEGVDEARPEAFALGVARGAHSLVRHTVGGTADSLASITGNFSRAASHLALDSEYRRRQRRKDDQRVSQDSVVVRRPVSYSPGGSTLFEGLADGFDSAVGGVVDGVTGLVQEPLRGAERDGAAGALLGVGRGLLGLVVKPVVGVADAATDVLRGIRNETHQSSQQQHHHLAGSPSASRRPLAQPPSSPGPPASPGGASRGPPPENTREAATTTRDGTPATHNEAGDDEAYDEKPIARRPRRALYGATRALRPYSLADAKAAEALAAAFAGAQVDQIDCFTERVSLSETSALVLSVGGFAILDDFDGAVVAAPLHLLLGCSLDTANCTALILVAEPPPGGPRQHVVRYEDAAAGERLHRALAAAVEDVHQRNSQKQRNSNNHSVSNNHYSKKKKNNSK